MRDFREPWTILDSRRKRPAAAPQPNRLSNRAAEAAGCSTAAVSAASSAVLGRGLRAVCPQGGHDQFVPVDAAEERRSSRDTFWNEAGCRVGAPGTQVLRKEAELETVRLRIPEDLFDDGSQQCSADTAAGRRDGNTLQQRDAFGRGPIPQNGEAGRLVAEQPEEMGVASVTERRKVLLLILAADDGVIAFQAFGRHDVGQIGSGGTSQMKMRHAR
ncbi:hypothetical protein [Bosea rubneri]|uniref:Uncharacterized protein n=1 Tax=Bosea rubneri TaxID=3075434 RepID=A0ABU3S9M1_9HYPH|nr:hypothetical protein [Bosea sp. ZW T0_25]MDU0341497.1 hypothetical protein [Bosea sp. ZW T0_25]